MVFCSLRFEGLLMQLLLVRCLTTLSTTTTIFFTLNYFNKLYLNTKKKRFNGLVIFFLVLFGFVFLFSILPFIAVKVQLHFEMHVQKNGWKL